MIKYCLEKWEENKDNLELNLRSISTGKTLKYEDLVKLVVDNIYTEYNSEKITEIDNGEYQGTLLYLIPYNTYQPNEYDYLMTHVYYGSCSGCDTLQHIYDFHTEICDDVTKELMNLAKDIVTNTIKPYNYGWKNNKEYDVV